MTMFASVILVILYLFLSVIRIVITGTGVSHENINNVAREGFDPHLSNALSSKDEKT